MPVGLLIKQSTRDYTYDAEVLSPTSVKCPLPPSPRTTPRSAVDTWNISVSNDGETFSNQLQLTVYDSKCLDCQCGEPCQLKVSELLMMSSTYGRMLIKTRKINQFC